MKSLEKGTKEKTKKPSAFRRVASLLALLLFAFVITVCLFLISLHLYIQSDRTKVFHNLPFLNGGSITFEAADISIFENFPKATISLKNLNLYDSKYKEHRKPLLELETLIASASLENIMALQIDMDSILLQNGLINLFTDENDYSNLGALFSKNASNPNKSESKKIQVLIDTQYISLSNIDFYFNNAIKTNSIHSKIEYLSADAFIYDEGFAAEIDMDLFMDELSFKKSNGSFVSNSNLKGIVKVQMKNGIISFEPFSLNINKEQFIFSGSFDTKKETISKLVLENENTNLAQTRPLLTPKLQQALAPFEIDKDFYSKTSITGYFRSDTQPIVSVDFHLRDNQAVANGFRFEALELNGSFVNRAYEGRRE
jgi:hypothetical protein